MNAKRIVITGATGGIGMAMVRAYAAPGIAFLLFGRDPARLAEAAQAAAAAGAMAEVRQIDATDRAGMAGALQAFDRDGPIDLLLLAAGVKTGNAGGVEPAGQLDRIVEVNLSAVILQVQAVLPAMRARGRGQIVLFGSAAALAPHADLLSYSATKAGIRAYGIALRRALRGSGVTVHVVTPGFVDTPMTDRHRGPTPLLISPARAARIIRRGVARGRATIGFPLALLVLIRLQNLLPPAVADWFDAGFRAEIEPDADERAAGTQPPPDQSQG